MPDGQRKAGDRKGRGPEVVQLPVPQLKDPSLLLLFLRAHDVADVLVTDPAAGEWGPIITQALGGAQPVTIGGSACGEPGSG